MKFYFRFAVTAVIASVPALAAAQQSAGTASTMAPPAAPVANPVTTVIKSQLTRYAKNMVAAAQSMPAEKYGFKPTPEMNSFGHLVMHITESNNLLCSKISGVAQPEAKLSETDGKEKLVSALQASFEFCSTALANVDDSKLGEQIVFFGNQPASRAAGMIGLSDGWNDHYGAQAVYLRLNGILPPTVQAARSEEKKKD